MFSLAVYFRQCLSELFSYKVGGGQDVRRNLLISCFLYFNFFFIFAGPGGDMQWCFSQVKGAIDDDVAEGKSSDMLKSRSDSEAREM